MIIQSIDYVTKRKDVWPTKKFIAALAVLSILTTSLLGFNVFAATYVYYPQDYTYVNMPGYGNDYFANASQTPSSSAIRTQQSNAAASMFHLVFKNSATPYYTNMWGTYSTSQNGAHEGIDMIYGTTGQPLYCWVKSGVVTKVDSSVGLVVIYYAKLNRSMFYRHMNSINVTTGQNVVQGQQIGTMGMKGNATGPHLHTDVMDGNVTADSADDDYFESSNPYTSFLNM
jgi:murein DD-endopeptidase MepM/ murein hydrolase activator NlpD